MADPDPITRLNAALEGRYRIERELGEGGMATVYLAEDLKHERKVALKVLKPELAAVVGADRFLAEIKTTANLQHPHILGLHDSGEADGLLFYVMPYVEGESLRDRLDREHQLPVDDAVRIATNLAEALDYAHRQGVIHRDIKPANVLLQDGKPVISDFGIALAVDTAGGGRLTETGHSLGTPHYMSPEQATGDLSVGPPTDIYAFGCVLYEMLVGEPPFTGSTPQAVLGKIITAEVPSARAERASVPPNVDAVIARALEKLPADRFVSAASVVTALSDPMFRLQAMPGEDFPLSARESRGITLPGWVAWGLAVLFAALAAWLWLTPDEPRPVVRYIQDFPPGEEPVIQAPGSMALAPDGHFLVYAGLDARLWLRERDRPTGRPIEGTESGLQPTFSPDGRELAFVTNEGQLLTVSLGGGLPLTLVESNVRRVGAAWGRDGYVYFTREPELTLHRVRADGGGTPEQLARLDSDLGQEIQHEWPEALPDGRILFSAGYAGVGESRIALLDPASGERRIVTSGRRPRYAASGHLLFVRADGSMYAAPFQEGQDSLTGPAVPIVTGLTPGLADFDISPEDGRLVYSSGGTREALWMDRDGSESVADSTWFISNGWPDLSPDGTRVVVGAHGDVWIKDLYDGHLAQLTFDGLNAYPAWTPGGDSVMFSAGPEGYGDLWVRKADGSESPGVLLDVERNVVQGVLSPDGASLVVRLGVGEEKDLFWTPRGDSVLRPLVVTAASERAPAFSPDGNWVAYVSDETGQDEVYVVGFPDAEGGPTQVTRNGGAEPVWSRSGAELFYVSASNWMTAVDVSVDDRLFVGAQTELFSTGGFQDVPNGRSYDISPDDERFLMVRRGSGDRSDGPRVVENFFAELQRLVPN